MLKSHKEYLTLYPQASALETIKAQKEKVASLVNLEPLELLYSRKKALRAVKQAYGYIQKVNQRNEQNALGVALIPPIKKDDLARDLLLWSRSLSISEREWSDLKNSTSIRRQRLQYSQDHKTPVRKVYAFLLALVIQQITQKRMDLARLRKIQNQLSSLSLTQANIETSPAAHRETLSGIIELKRKLVHLCVPKLYQLDTEVEQLLCLKKQMLELSLRLFFMEWFRKARDLPALSLGEIALKIKSPTFLEAPLSFIEQKEPDAQHETEYSIDEIQQMFDSLKHDIVEKSVERKLSAYSLFTHSPSSFEESVDTMTKRRSTLQSFEIAETF